MACVAHVCRRIEGHVLMHHTTPCQAALTQFFLVVVWCHRSCGGRMMAAHCRLVHTAAGLDLFLADCRGPCQHVC